MKRIIPILGMLLISWTPLSAMAIYNGRPVLQGDPLARHLVAIAIEKKISCSGALIRPNVVLTAAHCLTTFDVGKYKILFGLENPSREDHYYTWINDKMIEVDHRWKNFRRVKKVVQHPKFKSVDNNEDIGLILLDGEAPHFEPLNLTSSRTLFISDDDFFLALGYGLLGQFKPWGKLHRVDFAGSEFSWNRYNNKFMIPILYGGVCEGDSGGPLFKKVIVNGQESFVQVGIISAGFKTSRPSENPLFPRVCEPGDTDFFTNIYPYLDWINSVLREW